MKLKVWKWRHDWDDDSSTSLYGSEAAAKLAVHQYVHEQWDKGVMEDEKFTRDPDTDIEKYFECHGDHEWYSITSEMTEFSDLPNVDDEVVLTSNECAVVVAALSYSKYGEISKEMEVPMELKDIMECVDSAYNKLKD